MENHIVFLFVKSNLRTENISNRFKRSWKSLHNWKLPRKAFYLSKKALHMMLRFSIVLLLLCAYVFAQTDTTCSFVEANATAVHTFNYNNFATRNDPACCNICGRCSGIQDCCGINTGTNKCYYCTNGKMSIYLTFFDT